tara:strand:+ start:3067 stop:3405 length:339 start_codon:yes stop_codon:yes gene_type:complete
MNLRVRVDVHQAETLFYRALVDEFGPQVVQRERLLLGDVQISAMFGDRCKTILVEIKKKLDLTASIADGRLLNQCQRAVTGQLSGRSDREDITFVLMIGASPPLHDQSSRPV